MRLAPLQARPAPGTKASTTSRRSASAVQRRHGSDLHVRFPGQPQHPRQRRRQRQQPDGIGELKASFPNKLLHAIVQRVGHVKIALGIQRDAPGIAELPRRAARAAQNFQWLVLGVKYLNAAVAEFADVLQSAGVHAHVVRIAEFART